MQGVNEGMDNIIMLKQSRVVESYKNEGLGLEDIARLYRMSILEVEDVLVQNGIDLEATYRPQVTKTKEELIRLRHQGVEKLHSMGCKDSDIAKIYNYTEGTVKNLVTRKDVDTSDQIDTADSKKIAGRSSYPKVYYEVLLERSTRMGGGYSTSWTEGQALFPEEEVRKAITLFKKRKTHKLFRVEVFEIDDPPYFKTKMEEGEIVWLAGTEEKVIKFKKSGLFFPYSTRSKSVD